MGRDADQIANLAAELDALSSPTTVEVLAKSQDYDAGIVAAEAARRAIAAAAPGGGSQPGIAYGNGAPAAAGEATNAVQTLSDETDQGIESGTFKITFDGSTTAAIDVEVTDVEDILAMLEALPSVGAGNVALSGGPSGPFLDNGQIDIEFTGDLAGQEVELMVVADQALVSDGGPVDPSEFAWAMDTEGAAGTPASPADFATTLLYVNEDTGAVYANLAYPSAEAPDWQTPVIGAGSVTEAKIADGAVAETKIADGSVTAIKLDDLAVTTAKIDNEAVTGVQIAANAVEGTHIEDEAVTNGKLADNAVTGLKILNGTITDSEIADGSISAGKTTLPTSLPAVGEVWNDGGVWKARLS